ncbi:hypothetical protein FTV88_0243 [Heliorestis convoluta]|uniref:Uncharacterized protein n=1 Tax=Heliorestis convoluta TaxID=356322 RepID=A0A5Q2MZQ0_9FIRM|nr:hypothetical protein FTV88_0243 [Heliorestis convoluta]
MEKGTKKPPFSHYMQKNLVAKKGTAILTPTARLFVSAIACRLCVPCYRL